MVGKGLWEVVLSSASFIICQVNIVHLSSPQKAQWVLRELD